MAETKPRPACCPVCGSGRVARIFYGWFELTPELQRAVDNGELRAGGCILIPGESPRWACVQCDHRWADIEPNDSEPVCASESAVDEASPAPLPLPRRANSITLADLKLSSGLSNCLESESITTVADICMRDAQDLLDLRNFGQKRLQELRQKLAGFGLRLRGE